MGEITLTLLHSKLPLSSNLNVYSYLQFSRKLKIVTIAAFPPEQERILTEAQKSKNKSECDWGKKKSEPGSEIQDLGKHN